MNNIPYPRGSDNLYIIGSRIDVRPSLAFALNYFKGKSLVIMEIGVQRAAHSECIQAILTPKKLVLVDCWEPIDRREIGEDYRDAEESYVYIKDRFKDDSSVQLIKGRSQKVLPTMEADSFDMIYIDGDHFEWACFMDIMNSIRLVKKGGIIAGHDYGYNSMIIGKKMFQICVPAAIGRAFEGMFVYGEMGDWWVIVTSEIKNLLQKEIVDESDSCIDVKIYLNKENQK